jgi:VanZ family protein
MKSLMQPRLWQSLFFCAVAVCSWGFLKDVSGVPSEWMPNDKFMHLAIFAILMTLWLGSFANKLWLGVLVLAAYGGAIELAQAYFTTRMGDWWDWLADMLGIMLGILVYRFGLLPFNKPS